jgi:DNA-binding MltR family transcriptional regulator
MESTNKLLSNVERAVKQSQTAAVLVLASQLDNLLQHCLLRLMRDLSETKKEELFEGTGPLSTFSAKIRLAYAFRILDAKTVVTADRIRKIRNCFAHSENEITFDNEKVAKLAKELPGAKDHAKLKDAFAPAVQKLSREIVLALHNLTKE